MSCVCLRVCACQCPTTQDKMQLKGWFYFLWDVCCPPLVLFGSSQGPVCSTTPLPQLFSPPFILWVWDFQPEASALRLPLCPLRVP